jgi:phosphoenolpyruvate-protein kinase (PTS system EI component)
MLPMITSYAEVSTAREIIDHCIRAIGEERQQALDVPVGIMIETPAAAIMSDVLSKYVDFISIGTNDLTQYTLAADRTNELVSDMFDCIHPSVIRLMTIIVESAHRNGVEVSVCGEMAAQVAATDLLLGIGVQHFSVTPHVVPELQRRIQSAHIESSRQLVDQLVECRTSSDVRAMLLEYQSQERRSL